MAINFQLCADRGGRGQRIWRRCQDFTGLLLIHKIHSSYKIWMKFILMFRCLGLLGSWGFSNSHGAQSVSRWWSSPSPDFCQNIGKICLHALSKLVTHWIAIYFFYNMVRWWEFVCRQLRTQWRAATRSWDCCSCLWGWECSFLAGEFSLR